VSLLEPPQFASWADLEREALACTRCPLAETRTQVVFGVGDPHADLLFVGEGPGEQEDDGDEGAGAGVEALFEVPVGRIDAAAVESRDGKGRDGDHGQRQAQIHLDEAHAIDVALACGGDEGDGAGLGGHDGERHGVPRHGFVGEQILVRGLAAVAAPESIEDCADECGEENQPIGGSHGW